MNSVSLLIQYKCKISISLDFVINFHKREIIFLLHSYCVPSTDNLFACLFNDQKEKLNHFTFLKVSQI